MVLSTYCDPPYITSKIFEAQQDIGALFMVTYPPRANLTFLKIG